MLQGSNLETACCCLTLPICPPPSGHPLNLPSWLTLSNITFSTFIYPLPLPFIITCPGFCGRLITPCCPVGFCIMWLSWGHHPGSRYLVPSCDFPENCLIASSWRVQEPLPMALIQPHCKYKSFVSDYMVSGSAQGWLCLFLTLAVSSLCTLFLGRVKKSPLCCAASPLSCGWLWYDHCHLHHEAVRYKLMLFFPSSQEQAKHSRAVLMAWAAHTLTPNVLTVKTCFWYAHVCFSIIYSENSNFQSDV